MPKFLSEAFHLEAAAEPHWDAYPFGSHHVGQTLLTTSSSFSPAPETFLDGTGISRYHRARRRPSSLFVFGTSIDDGPDQQLWPWPIPKFRPKDPFAKLQKFLTGHNPPDDEPFGSDVQELEPALNNVHDQAKTAGEYAIEAEEAAQDAVSWDRGIVAAVNTADQAWDGALYAKKVAGKLKETEQGLEGLALKDWPEIADKIREFDLKVSQVITKKPGAAYSLNRSLLKMNSLINNAGKFIEHNRKEGTRPLVDFLSKTDHPPLFPKDDAPGVRDDGGMMVPFHGPDRPDPMVMEDFTSPDMHAVSTNQAFNARRHLDTAIAARHQ